ncbi:transferase [Basidiobolus meristosporus CBS 931.73]|uniref:Transferase n=1 Tax=Basidiobolus meristosporus CBS 931.73 TaxID=1314790 RepID=A0A1Y1YAF3_9FUNG|nr:transferase [Basidiobolus meristosporus CBS 931.73]|eukprot:ORX94943.1 transferase [Basidiobolus meristosporus CBS 931.73]
MTLSIESRTVLQAEPSPPSKAIRLSNNDVVMPRCFTRIALFFENSGQATDFMPTESLKLGLVALLKHYPILTGTLNNLADGNLEILLNNQGILFVEAKTDQEAGWFFDQDFQNLSDEYFPCGIFLLPSQPYIFAVQITRLPCGSVILGTALHHSVGDGNAFFSLLLNWSKMCRGLACEPVSHDRELLNTTGEPLQEHPEYLYVEPAPATTTAAEETKEKKTPPTLPPMEVKLFHIRKEKLAELKEAAQGDPGDVQVSTNDALIALVWRAVTRARGLSGEMKLKCGFACDGRRRLCPPLPLGYFGNANFYPCSQMTANQLISQPLRTAGLSIRASVNQMTSERIRDALSWVDSKEIKTNIQPGFSSFLGKDFAFTSWHQFPIYEVDFGYGTPVRARLPAGKFDGLAISLPRYDGDGVEMCVGLLAEHMRVFEMDEELQKYLSRTS